jgi:xanthine dehydrogenase YagT iron-sulfur-binding subunit
MIEETFEAGLNEDEKMLPQDLLSEKEQQLTGSGSQRREFLKQVLVAGSGILALQIAGEESLEAQTGGQHAAMPPGTENTVKLLFKVNGASQSVVVDSRTSLLDLLREKLALTGAKKGCDHGQCGACTVIADGQRVLSCLTLAATCEGKAIITIEGLARNGKLHPMQAAFLKHDGFQCGYCTPGQICSAVALIGELRNGDASYITGHLTPATGPIRPSADEIRERMSGNICRCGAYPNIVTAIQDVVGVRDSAEAWLFVEQKES